MNARAIPLIAIGDLVEPVRTWSPATKPDETFVYVDLSSVSQAAKQILAPTPILGSDAPSRARQLIRVGDVLVSTVRPNLNGVAPVSDDFDGATASTGFCVLRPRVQKIASEYLLHWVQSPQFVDQMVRQATGASYPAVSDKTIKASAIPLPPLDEQRRIAAILDKADALRRKRKRSLGLLDGLTQSIFLEMFGDPRRNPKKFEQRPLRSLVKAVIDCPHTTPNWTPSGRVALRTSNLTAGGWNWQDTRYVSPDEFRQRSTRAYVSAGDIILSREGTVGVVAIVEPGMEVCLGQRLVQIQPNENLLLKEFLLALLVYELAPERISTVMVGATSQHLNLKDLRGMLIPLPPKDIQEIFAARIRKISLILASQKQSDGIIGSNFSSLQHRAFAGEL